MCVRQYLGHTKHMDVQMKMSGSLLDVQVTWEVGEEVREKYIQEEARIGGTNIDYN